MGKIMKNGRSYSGWGSPGGGGASGPVVWVETQEASPAYPYRKYVTDVVETSIGQTTITPTYKFTDPDSSDVKYVHPSIVVDYSLPGLTQVKDNIYFTDYIVFNETSGTAYPTVTIDSVTFDDPNVESYSSFDLVNPQIYSGYIYAFLPQTIEFVYNQHSVTASFSGEFLRTQVGTYQHTQTNTKYSLGIAQS